MPHAVQQPRVLLALLASVGALCLGLIGPKPAEANWAGFCNVTVGSWAGCTGGLFYEDTVYGWGDQHSVCVGAPGFEETVRRCSSGPGVGVYSAKFGPLTWYPHIENHAAGTNTLHGIVLGP